jgi:hypothetical protein
MNSTKVRTIRRAIRAVVIACFAFGAPPSMAGNAAVKRLLMLDFEIVDTSNEPVDQRADHERRLVIVREAVATGLAARKIYEVVGREKIATELAAVREHQYLRGCNGCELTLGEHAGADLVMIGQVNKVSTLVMSMRVSIKDVKTGELKFFKTFDFRGDTDQSWDRAARYFTDRVADLPPG